MEPGCYSPSVTRSVVLLLCASCFIDAPAAPVGTLTFAVDAPADSEMYTCYAFDASWLQGRWITALHWAPPPDGDVVMHHATLYALASWSQGDVSTCWDMPPAATGLQVWVPGGGDLIMPSDTAIALPQAVSKLVVQVHSIRVASGPATQGSVTVESTGVQPIKVAAWLAMSAPIPALRPHMQDTSTAACTPIAGLHVIRDWPHMHLAGQEFHGSVLHPDGTTTPLVDVVPWDFYRQLTYDVAVDVSAGDQIQTNCIWFNQTDNYIFAGPLTTDEMCNQSLLVWPATSAFWEGTCL